MIGKPLLKLIALSLVYLFVPNSNLHHRLNSGTQSSSAPHIMLWAWERPERLSFLNSPNIGVAYLAETIYLNDRGDAIRARMQPLEVPNQTYLEAVVRIENHGKVDWNPSQDEVEKLAETIVCVTYKPGIKALQIDFDARQNERSAYKRLLCAVRAKLPEDKALNMTALASWCMGDRWIVDVPVATIVPMLFSMGVGKQEAFRFIETSRPGQLRDFQQSVGLSINDQRSLALLARQTDMNRSRVYFFSDRPWNPLLVRKAQNEVHKWQTPFAI